MLISRFAFAIVFLASTWAHAFRAIPQLTGPVIDEAGLLRPMELRQLEADIQSFRAKAQMQVWIVQSLEGEPIENLSIRATDAWKLGSAKGDEGLLVLIAVADRQMRIEVGQGLEGDVTDGEAKRVIAQVLTPAFRSEEYFLGLRAALRTLFVEVGGDPAVLQGGKFVSKAESKGGIGGLFKILFWLFVLFMMRSSRRGRRAVLGGMVGGASWGGGRGWGGGGGGWSGGGGGFSGGGASGRW